LEVLMMKRFTILFRRVVFSTMAVLFLVMAWKNLGHTSPPEEEKAIRDCLAQFWTAKFTGPLEDYLKVISVPFAEIRPPGGKEKSELLSAKQIRKAFTIPQDSKSKYADILRELPSSRRNLYAKLRQEMEAIDIDIVSPTVAVAKTDVGSPIICLLGRQHNGEWVVVAIYYE